MLPDRTRQPGRHLDREHHRDLRHRDPSARRRLIHVPAGLPRRAPEPAGQHPGRLTRRHAPLSQLRGRVDPLRMLAAARAAMDSHAINILPDMSLPGRDTPRPFQPSVAQRDIKAEVIHCVGGVTGPPWGVPSPVGVNRPFSITPALSHPAICSLAGNMPSWPRR